MLSFKEHAAIAAMQAIIQARSFVPHQTQRPTYPAREVICKEAAEFAFELNRQMQEREALATEAYG
jgi:hypothetical protein